MTSEPRVPVRRRVLEPIDRVSEVLFGLIMVLTFTGSLSIAESGREDVRTMLIGALGCNLAWGIIDAILYLMGAAAEHGRDLKVFRALRATQDASQGQRIVADALPPLVASVAPVSVLEDLRTRLRALPDPPSRPAPLGRDEWLGAVGVFLLVFLSTLPVVVPFVVMDDARMALRVSNGIAVGLLFVTGYAYARIVGRTPWITGLVMVALGLALVSLTMVLGG